MNLFLKTIFLLGLTLPTAAVFAAEDDSIKGEAKPSIEESKQGVKELHLHFRFENKYAKDLQSAIKDQDIELYSEKMKYLLENANMEDFLQVLLFEDTKGNNIFHLIAGVKDAEPREFFAHEMQTLFDFFAGELKSKFSLGNSEYIIPPLLEDNLFVQAVSGPQAKNTIEITAPIKAKEKLTRLKIEAPAIEFIKAIYARDNIGQTLIEQFSHQLSSLPAFSPSEELIEKWQKTNKILNKALAGLLLNENIQGQKPIDIAYKTENPQAYRILEKASSVKNRFFEFLMYASAGFLVYEALLFSTYFDNPDAVLNGLISGALLYGGSLGCYHAISQIKRKKLQSQEN